MLDSMTAQELLDWQAFERVEPFGQPWDNWVQARHAQAIDRTIPRKPPYNYRRLSDLLWTPPEPIAATRLREKEPD